MFWRFLQVNGHAASQFVNWSIQVRDAMTLVQEKIALFNMESYQRAQRWSLEHVPINVPPVIFDFTETKTSYKFSCFDFNTGKIRLNKCALSTTAKTIFHERHDLLDRAFAMAWHLTGNDLYHLSGDETARQKVSKMLGPPLEAKKELADGV